MKVGILGSGVVASALAKGFLSRGHEVQYGTRDPAREDIQKLLSETKGSTAASNAEMAAWSDIIVIATKWTGTENAIKLANPDNFKGKVVLDATNPLPDNAFGPHGLQITTGTEFSGGELVQQWLPGALVVKAFNTIGNGVMVDPTYPGGEKPDMWIAGNDAEAKQKVRDIILSFGWGNALDAGDITCSRWLEALCALWVNYAAKNQAWGHSFKMLIPASSSK